MKVKIRRIEFSCSLFLIVTYLLVLCLLINLGLWQLNRAAEKRVLIEKQAQSLKAAPLQLVTTTIDDSASLRYRKVTLSGAYDVENQFLLDNQVLNGKVGYFVLTPFLLSEGKKAVLINRGWIAANPDRRVLPDVKMKSLDLLSFKNLKGLNISGRINHFPSVGIKLEGAGIPTQTSPAVIQIVDAQLLAKKLGYPLFSFLVELDANNVEGYTRQWQTTTLMSPQQHFGYALQWFGLAIALSILFFWYSSKKQTDDESTTTKS